MSNPVEPATATVSQPVYRHRLVVRITHWINAVAIILLLLTGVEILAHHPELYWGETGFFGDPAFLSFGKREYEYIGMGNGRSIHFLMAWILVGNAFVYFVSAIINGHLAKRLLPAARELTGKAIARTLRDHIRFRHVTHSGDYNLLQKIAYLTVLFLLGPVMVLTGLAMSPAVTTVHPWLIEMFAGRQTARTIHFLCASGLLVFLLIHVWQVWLVGWRREMRAMITGWDMPSEKRP